jgi:antitoxin component YwqK of YwqJK toxin-antitoxin module
MGNTKKKLFIPRKIDERKKEWNEMQPIIDGKPINQYDLSSGEPTGRWGEGDMDGGDTTDLFATYWDVFSDDYWSSESKSYDKEYIFNDLKERISNNFIHDMSEDAPLGHMYFDLTIPFNSQEVRDRFEEIYEESGFNKTLDEGKKLFVPRRISGEDSRWVEWNKDQPEIDGVKINQYDINTGGREGMWFEYLDGKIVSKKEYKNGEYDGIYQVFYEDGQIQYDGQTKNNEFVGLWEIYYPNGQLSSKGSYKNGLSVGLWKWYYSTDNQLMSIVNYIDGKPDGLNIDYYQNGNIKHKAYYKMGKKKAYVLYDMSGDEIESMDWDDKYENMVIKEEMENKEKIFKSFEMKDHLNPKIWDENDKLKKRIKETLMAIGQEFHKSLEVEAPIDDIIFTGSLANFNWSEYSDVDLHVLIDFNKFDDKELIKKYFDAKKAVWNDNHDIKIKGYDVELYAQDKDEPHESTGIYSVMNDEWIKKPKPQDVKIDKQTIKKKVRQFEGEYNRIVQLYKDGKYEETRKALDKIKDKIKKYRKAGLDKGGEMATENLVFKTMRRSGLMDKIYELGLETTDKEYTIETLDESETPKKKLFIPRRISGEDSRWADWNKEQPIVNGERINQYDINTGKEEGYWEFYWGSGNLHTKCSYKNGILDGLYESYWENGQLHQKGLYNRGNKYGIWVEYWRGGSLRKKELYENDKVVKRLDENINEGKISDNIDDVLKNFKKNFKLDAGFLTSFGAGINALIRNISSLIKEYSVQPLSAFEMTNLAIAMIVVYFRQNKSLKGFKDEMLSIAAFTSLMPAYLDIVNSLLGNVDFMDAFMTIIKSAGVYAMLTHFKSK